jgi:molybdopterin-guanine dinucleotide biosynthesis protein A
MSSLWAILNGGQSSRFGSPKYLAMSNGESFFNLAAKRTSDASNDEDRIVLSGGPIVDSPFDVVEDSAKYAGPLAGLHALLQVAIKAQNDILFIQPIDMPVLQSRHLRLLRDRVVHSKGIVVAESQLSKDRHWVLAAVHCSHYEEVVIHIEKETYRSMKNLWSACACEFLAFPDEFLVNVNYPEQVS